MPRSLEAKTRKMLRRMTTGWAPDMGDNGTRKRWEAGRDAAEDGDPNTRPAEAGQNGHGDKIHGVGQSSLYERSPQYSLQISVGGGKVAVLTVQLGHDTHSGAQASMVAAVALGRSEDSSVSQHRRVDESHPCDVLKP